MRKEEFGQSLVEAIIALTAAIIVVSSITTAIVLSLNNVQYSKYQNLATQYAQEGIEIVRKISAEDWNNFKTSYVSINYCLPEESLAPTPVSSDCDANLYKVGPAQQPIFKRSIKIEHNVLSCNGGSMITSIVSWSDSKCTSETYCHKVELNTCITQSQNIPTP